MTEQELKDKLDRANDKKTKLDEEVETLAAKLSALQNKRMNAYLDEHYQGIRRIAVKDAITQHISNHRYAIFGNVINDWLLIFSVEHYGGELTFWLRDKISTFPVPKTVFKAAYESMSADELAQAKGE